MRTRLTLVSDPFDPMAKRISTKLTTQVLSLRVASMSLDDAVVCAGVVCLWAPLVVFVILVGLAADGGDVSWYVAAPCAGYDTLLAHNFPHQDWRLHSPVDC